jgi:micrococcal nuclease
MSLTSKILAVFLLTILLLSPVAAEEFKGKVIKVADGDTIHVLRDYTTVKVRLSGVDTPEKKQAFGQQAKNFTAAQCFGQEVKVVALERDKYGRVVGEVTLADGRDLNKELVKAGYAWWYRKYAPKANDLEELELDARSNGRGLWADPHAVAPWEFRHTK